MIGRDTIARHAVIKSFYASARWLKFRATIVLQRNLTCEKCGKVIALPRDAHVHHIVELTPDNVHDASVTLNPCNVLLYCRDCHDDEHERFGHTKAKQVYIVYGCPCAGKTSYVLQNKKRNDIVVCIDSLFAAITGLPEHDKPDQLLSTIRSVYNALLDQVKTRYGKWSTAWIIGGYSDKYKRDKLADELGAELIYCECTKEEAIGRIDMDDRRINMKAEYIQYIERWFSEYSE